MSHAPTASTTSTHAQRVVITGLGCVSSVGPSAPATWQALVSGRSGIRRVEEFADFPASVYAPAASHDPEVLRRDSPSQPLRHTTVPMRLFHAAVREAYEAAHLAPHVSRTRVGLIAGTTANYPVEVGRDDLLAYYACADAATGGLDWVRYLDRQVYPHSHFFQHTTNLLTCAPAIHFGFTGINETLHNACASGTQAVGQAFRLIRHGYADVVLAGGAEALVNVAGVTAMGKLGVLSPQADPTIACRPFDQERDGLVLGEGAAVLVVESLASAAARGATILAEIVGFGSSANAYRVTDSPEDGVAAAAAIRQCLDDAGVHPCQIGAISAHGTSTRQNDLAESNAIKGALGEHAGRVPVFALKSMLGHALSAAGAIELVAAVYTLRTGIVPGIPSYRTPDRACDLRVVSESYQDRSLEYLLKNSFGFGGQNGSLLMRTWRG